MKIFVIILLLISLYFSILCNVIYKESNEKLVWANDTLSIDFKAERRLLLNCKIENQVNIWDYEIENLGGDYFPPIPEGGE